MAKVVLQPCRFRAGKFSPDLDQPAFEMSFQEIIQKFNLDIKDKTARAKIQTLQPRAYIGLSHGSVTGKVVCFVILNSNRGSSYDWISKKDPLFESRIVEVYRVESVVKDGKLEEASVAVKNGVPVKEVAA